MNVRILRPIFALLLMLFVLPSHAVPYRAAR
jgi:hypothetical protein